MTKQYSGRALKFTETWEELRLVAYHGKADRPDVWTIGFGHIKGVQEGDTCTREQAEQWLLEDIQDAVDAVNNYVTVELTQDEFDATVDLVFNCGIAPLRGTFGRLLNAGDYDAAATEIEAWDHANGKVVAGLLRRRLGEEAIFREGM